jgi:hypothetical protein
MGLTAYSKTCAAHTPGNSQLILVAADDITSVTLDSGEVSEMAQNVPNKAKIISADRDGVGRMDEKTATKGGLFYVNQKIEVDLSKSSKDLQAFIKSVADDSACGILAILTDNNGERWLLGAQKATATSATPVGLYMESANFTSGKALDEEDGDKYVLTLSGMLANGAIHIKSTSTINVASTDLIE